jgi:hypothetical protein
LTRLKPIVVAAAAAAIAVVKPVVFVVASVIADSMSNAQAV